MNKTQRDLLNRLSELEGKWGNMTKISSKMGIPREEIERQFDLLQDDGLLEWETKTFTLFSFRITAEGYRELNKASKD